MPRDKALGKRGIFSASLASVLRRKTWRDEPAQLRGKRAASRFLALHWHYSNCTRCHPYLFLKAGRWLHRHSSDTASGHLQPRTGLSVTRAGKVGWGGSPPSRKMLPMGGSSPGESQTLEPGEGKEFARALVLGQSQD